MLTFIYKYIDFKEKKVYICVLKQLKRMLKKTIKPPNPICLNKDDSKTIFLAGTIDIFFNFLGNSTYL